MFVGVSFFFFVGQKCEQFEECKYLEWRMFNIMRRYYKYLIFLLSPEKFRSNINFTESKVGSVLLVRSVTQWLFRFCNLFFFLDCSNTVLAHLVCSTGYCKLITGARTHPELSAILIIVIFTIFLRHSIYIFINSLYSIFFFHRIISFLYTIIHYIIFIFHISIYQFRNLYSSSFFFLEKYFFTVLKILFCLIILTRKINFPFVEIKIEL